MLREAKTPRSTDNHVGLELEFFCKADQDQLCKKLYAAGLSPYLHVKTDGSIRAEDERPYSHEICILATEAMYEEIVEKTCRIIKEVGGKVNKSCGMHVHIDMRNRDREIAFSNLVSSQNILYSMNPKSRLEPSANGTRYCAITRGKKFNPNMNRYHGINASAINRHGTIEVRIHSGTIDPRKITNWVKLLLHITTRPTAVARAASTFKGFVNQFEVPMELAEYIVERVKKFADPEVQEEAA